LTIEGFRVMLPPAELAASESPSKEADFPCGFDLPVKTRRASQKGAETRAVLFERSEFHCSPPALRSTGQPAGPRFMGVFFWFVFFHAKENERNIT
jgi:hypothetical protein